jgi:hypothetical protein
MPPHHPIQATCHPEQPHFAKGLCAACYKRKASREYYHSSEKYRAHIKKYNQTVGKAYRNEYNRLHGRAALLKHRYDLSIEEYDALVTKQNGVCAICGEPPRGKMKRLSVDHNHETGKVRGLLCITCNRVLGYFENADWHWAANKYLAAGMPETPPIEPSK